MSFDPMKIADSIAKSAEAYAGMRNAYIEKGFTPDQAGDLIVAGAQMAAAQDWAKALGREEKK